MKFAFRNFGCLLLLVSALCNAQTPSNVQTPGNAASPSASQLPDKPLPDIPTLMREVEAHQKATEALERDYLYHSFVTEQALDSNGGVKKTQTEDSDIFYVAGARLRRLLKRDGKDLSPDEQRKESEKIDKEIAKAKANRGKPAPNERDEVTVSRFLELGSFSHARRLAIDGRSTIAVDFTGNPKAKTHTRFEGAIREMEGTIWVDEQDRALRRLQGRFINPFKIGGGMLADIKKDSSFQAEWTKVNGEVWLPASVSGQGSVRVLLLLNFHGSLRATTSNFRKFKATATILPGVGTVEAEPQTPQLGSPPPPASAPPQ